MLPTGLCSELAGPRRGHPEADATAQAELSQLWSAIRASVRAAAAQTNGVASRCMSRL